MPQIYYPLANYTPTLEPIMEEEENDAEANNVMAVITSTCTSDRFGLSTSELEHERTPQNTHKKNRSDDAVLPHIKWECGAEDLEHSTKKSDFLKCISWYQAEYDELQEFTRNEKEAYEEFFSDQILEANKKIYELEDKNERLEAKLNESEDRCKDIMSTLMLLDKSGTCDGESKKTELLEKELKLLRIKLLESETRRDDSEMRWELTESNLRNRCDELKQCLEEARAACSNTEEANVCHHCNGQADNEIRCEEKNEDGFPAEVTKLKQENIKLTEDLNKTIVKLRETVDEQSLLLEHICKMENEKLKLSESLETTFEVVRNLNSEISKLKKENYEMHNKYAIISRSLEGKYEESGKQISENPRLEKENIALGDEIANVPKMLEDTIMEITELRLKYLRLEEEICSVKNDNLNLSNVLEENILKIKHDMKSEVLSELNNNIMKENANIFTVTGEKHELGKRKLETEMLYSHGMPTSERDQQGEKLQSARNASYMKIALQENRELKCLKRKVAWQRRILNTTRERELKMKTELELCKNRIVQLESQTQNENHMRYIAYLESIVTSLKNENVILRIHLGRVQRQMKIIVSKAMVRNRHSQLRHKHVAVQTSISLSDFCPITMTVQKDGKE
ncbi:filamin-A-interacting protein 1-like [Cryptotermes secundus]|uniref:filamin-A-interacting protein 1-like n=1 Tax=Cryptotermes secundus TaxID=105785 RepID=UPI001454C39A|nr:filamin-A-interacting protein 1-like [Cryptotermes secundus]